MKNLVFGDIHNKTGIVDRVVEYEKPEQIVCLGDYFDDFGDSVVDAERSAVWLRNKIEAGWIMLLGNHDAAYMASAFRKYIDVRPFMCSGYSRNKSDAINKIMRRKHWLDMKLWTTLGKYVLTHAGFNHRFIHPLHGLSEEWLRSMHGRVMRETFVENSPWNILTYCAPGRGGRDPYSGILWQDWAEFKPTPGVSQIFGHTPGPEPRYISEESSFNVCIDTHLKHYIVYEAGKPLIIKKTEHCREKVSNE